MVAEALFSSACADWCTPRHVVERVRAFGDGKIGLDPCSNPHSIVGAAHSWVLPTNDGLHLPWAHHGLIYCNPPYGRQIGLWTRKAVAEAQQGAEIIMLIPARTDTLWWHSTAPTTRAFTMIAGRLTFLNGKYPAPFPSALLYWGSFNQRFAEVFDDLGWTVTL